LGQKGPFFSPGKVKRGKKDRFPAGPPGPVIKRTKKGLFPVESPRAPGTKRGNGAFFLKTFPGQREGAGPAGFETGVFGVSGLHRVFSPPSKGGETAGQFPLAPVSARDYKPEYPLPIHPPGGTMRLAKPFLLAVMLLLTLPCAAPAGAPSSEPVLRIDTAMHTARIKDK